MKVKSRTASDGSDSKKTLPKLAKKEPSGTTVSKKNTHASRSKKISHSNKTSSSIAAMDISK